MKTSNDSPLASCHSSLLIALAAAILLSAASRAPAQAVPGVVTWPATEVVSAGTNAGARLNGTVKANGAMTVAWFEWGAGAYEHATPATNVGNGVQAIAVSNGLTELTAGLVYHGRLVASNSLGVAFGADRQFTPLLVAPNGGSLLTNECHTSFTDLGASASAAPVAIAGGDFHSVALKADGTVVGWGTNDLGQTTGGRAGSNIVAIASHEHFNLALKADGTVVGWGSNGYGQTNSPAEATNVVAIAAGQYHSLALRGDGRVVGWGFNGYGQTASPAEATNVVAIAGGEYHSLALRRDGSVIGWGSTAYGQLSIPSSVTNVVAIASGFNHALALRADGQVIGWGRNFEGQISIPASATNVVAIAAGAHHSLALRADGQALVWGNNSYGQANLPAGLSNVVAIAGGRWHSLALRTDGTVVGWGRNDGGQSNGPTGLNALGLAIAASGMVDTNSLATYVLTYAVTNPLGAAATATREVVVRDTLPPVLSLLGPNPLTRPGGTAYVDPGATAVDECGGDLTASIQTNITVNSTVPGTYTNTYTVTDAGGNSAVTNRTVIIEGVAPTVTTLPPTRVNSAGAKASATLNGTVNPNGRETCAWFEWGPSGQFVNLTTVSNPGSGGTAVSLLADLTNLTAGASYQYRLMASNSLGLFVGSSQCLGPLQIVLQGAEPMFVLCSNSFSEPGFVVVDPCSAPFAGTSNFTGTVDVNVTGTYLRTYSATNTLGWTATATRTVRVMPPLSTPVVYVNKNAPFTSQQDGSSWADAFRELRDALAVVNPTTNNPIEIWVAKGTYKPTGGLDRNASFVLKNGLTIRGGFAGNEALPENRAASGYWTVLSGDIGVPQTNAITDSASPEGAALASSFVRDEPGFQDNCYNVLRGSNATQVVLERLYVTGGNANHDGYSDVELVMMTHPAASTDNRGLHGETVLELDPRVMGGGLFVTNCWDWPEVTNRWDLVLSHCVFINNATRGYGGAAAVREARIRLEECFFLKNASGQDGGALWGQNLRAVASEHCIFWFNQAGGSGGGVHFQTLATLLDAFRDPFGQLSDQNYVDMINNSVEMVSLMRAAYSANSIKNFIQLATIGQISTASTAATAVSYVFAVYAVVCLAVDAVDFGMWIAEQSGANMDTEFVRTWRKISYNFNLYATPGGWLWLLANIGAEDYELTSLEEERLGLKRWQECLYNPDPYAVLVGSEFRGNSAGGDGGAMSCVRDNVHWESCLFEENSAAGNGGALASSTWNEPRLMNCVFYRNYSTNGHSGMLNVFHSRARILNCTWVENGAGTTNGFCVGSELGSDVRIANSILWGNTNLAHPQGGADLFVATPETILKGDTNTVAEYQKNPAAQMDYWGLMDVSYSCVQSLTNLPLGESQVIYWDKDFLLRMQEDGRFYSYFFGPHDVPWMTEDYFRGQHYGIPEYWNYFEIGWGTQPRILDARWGNTARDPLLVNGYIPSSVWPGLSPMIDAGSADKINPLPPDLLKPESERRPRLVYSLFPDRDYLQNSRVVGQVDMGAVENQSWWGVVYVRADATGDNSGRDWTNAMTDLSDAFRIPGRYDTEIWVAAGTYYPTTLGVRSASFSLPNGARIYGGFGGWETNLAQRNWQTNVTILSGNLGDPNSDLDNSYHVISNAFLLHNTVLDGFTITGGRATGGSETNGGGIYNYLAAPVVQNCTFVDNGAAGDGGAIFSAGSEDIAKVVNCRFVGNRAGRGGAMYYEGSSVEAETCRFEQNSASSGGALGFANRGLWTSYVCNSLFLSNSVSGPEGSCGGALLGTNTSLGVYFCTFYGNAVNVSNGSSRGGGALEVQGGADAWYQVWDNLFWANTATVQGGGAIRLDRQQVTWDMQALNSFRDNFIQGLMSLPGVDEWWYSYYNSDRNPSFVDAANGDFRLNPTSPAVDAVGEAYSWLPEVDLDGNPRAVNGGWDLGAFEYQGPPVAGKYRVAITRLTDGGDVVYRLDLLPGTDPLPAAYHWEVCAGGDFGAVPDGPPFQGITTATLFITNPSYSMNGWRFRARDDNPAGFISDEAQLRLPRPVVYVKADAPGYHDGSDWTHAFTRLEDALAAVAPNCQVWVAAGIYHPSSARLPSEVNVYGGFSGTETELSQRDWRAHPTVLSGDVGIPGESSDNTGCLVYCESNAYGAQCTNAVLDGFTLRGAADNAVFLSGAKVAVRNCTFEANQTSSRGAAVCLLQRAVLEMTSCIIRSNYTADFGTIYAQNDSSLSLTNCLFHDNTASRGGALGLLGAYASFMNCTITAHTGSYYGAGIYVADGTVSICNSILWGNRGRWGAGTAIDQVWAPSGGLSISHSCIQGQTDLTQGNINYDPGFANPAAADFRLSASSPAVDAGFSPWVAGLTTDLGGATRLAGPEVDMGAFESPTAGDKVLLTEVPSSVQTCANSPVSFNVVGANNYTFYWQVDAGSGFVNATNGGLFTITDTSNASTLSLAHATPAMAGWKFRFGVAGSSFVSQPVELRVNPNQVLYVNAAAQGANNGLDWANAFTNLQAALDAAPDCTELWVAQGTYGPGRFVRRSAAALYGGFSGVETNLDQRDWVQHPTVVPGFDFDHDTRPLDVLDGFTITGDLGSLDRIYVCAASPTIRNCLFTNNNGAATGCIRIEDSSPTIANCTFAGNAAFSILNGGSPAILNCLFTNNAAPAIGNSATPTISNCVFVANHYDDSSGGAILNCGRPLIVRSMFRNNSASEGGAIYNWGWPQHGLHGSPAISECEFTGNTSLYGGALYNSEDSSAAITNCLFADNTSQFRGGAIEHLGATLTAVNCTFTENASAWGGGIYNHGDRVQVLNSILWENTEQIADSAGTAQFAYSIVQGLPFVPGSSNLPWNPLFRDPVAGDWRLDAHSPAINAGNPLAVAAATDLDGLPRVQSTSVDLGAYEFQGAPAEALSVSPPLSTSVCVNRAVQFTATAQLNPGYVLSWQKQVEPEFVALTNDATYTITTSSNGGTLAIPNATLPMNGETYRLQLLDSTNVLYTSPTFTLTVLPPTILHVDGSVAASGNGLSWSNAFARIEQAVAAAGDCSEIWVAAGTYRPQWFSLKPGVALYGGFAGTETAREQRDWTAHSSILQATPGDGIIYNSGLHTPVDATAVLDGFTLTGASGYPALCNYGASPTIANCTFDGNDDNAVHNYVATEHSYLQCRPVFTNCVFRNNTSDAALFNSRASPTVRHCVFLNNRNGAVENHWSSPLFEDCDFIGNSAGLGGALRGLDNSSLYLVRCRFLGNVSATDGGVAYLQNSAATLSGCLLVNNAAQRGGGLTSRSSSQVTLYNCTLSRNTATLQGGGLYLDDGGASVNNSILWNNSDGGELQSKLESAQIRDGYLPASIQVANSCIQGLSRYAGNNNLPYDPLFVAPEATNFTLSGSSPAVNVGNNALVNGQTVDLASAPRIASAAVDMGAYELQSGPSGSPVQVYLVPESQAGCGSVRFTAKGLPGSAANFHWWYLAGGTNPVAIPADGYHSVQAANDTSTLIISDAPAEFNGRSYQLQFSDGSVDYWAPPVTFVSTPRSIIYVRADAAGANNGMDWANAFTNLPDALAIGGACSEIWVAAGTYSQSLPCRLTNGRAVYGGFSGTETNRTARDWVANPTILHGPGDGQIFLHSGTVLERSARLDGFILENASEAIYNNGASPTLANCLFRSCSRSGIYNVNASPLIRGCVFVSIAEQAVSNSGGAPQIEECQFAQNGAGVFSSQGSSVTIAHCQFTNHSQRAVSHSAGSLQLSNCVFVANPGAVYAENSAALVTHCSFLGNSAYKGAGLDLYQCSSAGVVNCLFSGNFAGLAGAAIFADASTLTIRNCTVSGNRAGAAAAGIYSQNGACSVYNSILWNNWSDPSGASAQAQFFGTITDAQNNCVQGGAWGTWNTEPLFVAGVNPAGAPTATGDYRLTEASPLIDLGLDAQAAGIDVDLDGAPRHVEAVDLGAYELQVGSATALAFTTPPQVLIAGQLSGAITIQRRGTHNHPAPAEPDLLLTLATSSGTGVFRDLADTTDLANVIITQGCSSVSFRYQDALEGAPVLTVSAAGLSSVTQTQIVTHSTRLTFATPPRTIERGALSDAITVQRQDDAGWPVAGESNIVVSLSTTSGSGVFRDLADTTNLTSLTITQGASSVSFRYRDDLVGEPVLTISAAGLASATQTQAVIRLSQTITFETLPTRVYGDAPFALNATASSSLPVSFSIASGPATVSNNVLTITGVGTVTVRASQPGGATHQPAPDVDQSFTVSPATLTIVANDAWRRYGEPDPVFTGTITGLQYGDTVTATYGAAVTSTTPPGVYPIVPTPVDAQSKLANYFVNLTNGTLTISPGLASALVFATPPRTNGLGVLSEVITVQRQDDAGWLVSGESNLLVNLSTSSAGGAFRDLADTTNLTSLTLTQGASSVSFRYRDDLLGEPVLTATATGLASATQTQTVIRLSQTIAFVALPARSYGAPPFALNATASSGLPVSFSIVSGPATVSSNLLTITGTGLVTVRASQAGDETHQSAPDVDRSFTVAPAALTVVANDASRRYGEPDPVFTGTITGRQYEDELTASYAALGPPPATEPLLFDFTLGGIYYPYHVAVDTEGRIYVSSSDYINKFNTNGAYLGRWGGRGSTPGKLSHADGVAVDGSNYVYVADYSNHRVQKFTTDGIYVLQWGGYGSGNGQFKYPSSVAVDRNGNVYVGDAENYRIQKFSSNGTYLTQWGSYGWGDGQFDILYGGIAIDNSGNVYVADTFNYRIQKFTSNGAYLTQWGGTYGTDPGQFARPYGLALDSSGCVYVCEDVNSRVQKFTSDGTYLTQWGSEGSGNGQLHLPWGLTVDSRDRVFVADKYNNRIQVFRPAYGPPVTSTTPPGTYPIVPTVLDPQGRLTNYLVSLTNGTLTIQPGVATNLVFTTPPYLLETGDLSDAITIQRQDVWAHPVSAEPDLVLALSSTSGGGVFRDLADTTNLSSLTIPQGASSLSFRYRDTTMGAPVLTVSTPGLCSATQTQIVTAATRLDFTTPSCLLEVGQLSGIITVERRDDAARPIVRQPDLLVSLGTTSSGGVFRDLADTTNLASLTIAQGASSVSFRYRDTTMGTPVLTVSAPGLSSATQTQIVIAATRLVFTTPSQNLQAGQLSGVMTLQRQDDAARPIITQPDLQVTLSTTSGGGVFRDLADTANLTSLIITQGGSSVSFRYRDNFGGTPVLTAEAPGLASAMQTQNVSRLSQTITFGALPSRIYGDPPFMLSATASSGLPVSFSVVSGSATVNSNLLALTGVGLVTVRASQPGDPTYQPAPDVDRTFTITQAVLTVVADNAQRRYGETNPVFTGTLTGVQYGDSITATYAALEPSPSTNPPVFDRAFGAEQFSHPPADIAVDTDGNVFVTSAWEAHLYKFHSGGTFLTGWEVFYAQGVAVDRSNQVYVTDDVNHFLRKFTTDGNYLTNWGSYGAGAGQLNRPWGIAADGNGDVYVGDSWNARIQKFTSSGTYLTQWGGQGAGDGQFGHPLRGSIAVDTKGDVYVVDEANCRIQKFTSNGVFLAKWGAYGSGAGQFIYPKGVALDSRGYVYVADSGNDRIQKFTSAGDYLAQCGGYGAGSGQFNNPAGLAMSSSDELYVLDAGNYRIQKFRPCYGPPVTPAAPPGAYPIVATLADPQNRLTNYLVTITRGTLTINPGPASALVFTTPPHALEVGQLSGTVTVQRQDSGGSPVFLDPDLSVSLSTSSGSGVFRDLADTTNLTSLTITQGTSSVSFRYQDSVVGNPVLTAAATALPSASQTQTVSRLSQTIAFGILPGRVYGALPFILNATASSGLPVSFSIVSGPATINSNLLSITGAGPVTVRASQAGGPTYQPAPDVDQSFTVAKALLTVVADDAQRTYGAPDPLYTGTLTGIQYADDITATYAAPVTSTTPPGTYPIVPTLVDPAGRLTNYTVSVTNGTLTITPNPASVLTFITPPRTFEISQLCAAIIVQRQDSYGNPVSAEPNLLVNLSSTSGGGVFRDLADSTNLISVTITQGTSSVSFCYRDSVVGAPVLTAAAEGLAGATQTQAVTRLNQSITFAPLPDRVYGDPPFILNATASSALPVSFSIVAGPATLNSNRLTITGAGQVVVRASQAGNAMYEAATNVDRSFTIAKALLTVVAFNAQRFYDTPDPVLTGTIGGIQYGDNITATYAALEPPPATNPPVFDLSFGSQQNPTDAAVDGAGNVYVVGGYGFSVRKFSRDGTTLTNWSTPYPMGIAVDRSNHVYITDHINAQVRRFTTNGVLELQWGSRGSGNGQFYTPWHIAVDGNGYVYVVDANGQRVHKFTSTGVYLTQWGGFAWNGDLRGGIAVDTNGIVYVADYLNCCIKKFTSSGGFISSWGSYGSAAGQFIYPGGVAVDSSGFIYVADTGNNRIQKFSSTGNYLAQWGNSGTNNGQFNSPGSLAISTSNEVYVVDSNNQRIQKFRPGYGPPVTATTPPGIYPILSTLLDPDGKLANYTVIITNGTLTILGSPGVFLGITAQPGPAFLLHCSGGAGLTYTLQTSGNLVDWTDYTNLVAGTNGLFDYLETTQTNAPSRFYRLRYP